VTTNRFALISFCLVLTACPKKEQAFTAAEARQSLEQASDASSAENLTAASVEISTNFTVGQGVDAAAAELRTFVASQIPCAEITLSGATLTIEYGVNDGSCTYRGHEFSGSHSITVSKNDADQVIVDHEWTDFSNGVLELDGTAHVTWDFEAESRRVEHESHWTHLASGRTGTGSGDRTQTLLEGGLAEGIRVDGSRSWQGQRGQWDLAIDGVEMRWADPVPQAGSYTLSTPFDKTVTLSFARKDEDTITVTVAGPKRSFDFDVSKAGVIQSRS
jgi:hypothetical protein